MHSESNIQILITSIFVFTIPARVCLHLHNDGESSICAHTQLVSHLATVLTKRERDLCLHSRRLFCSGVPVRMMRLRVVILFMALEMAEQSFFRMWPSSQITRSGPVTSAAGKTRHVATSFLYSFTLLCSHQNYFCFRESIKS